ncbi:hypothetical protein [Flavobacterium psychrotrophum]|uniref:hypothetical protein n=1 Tax=Flavobacterium psychrotrophum TaxID=2294119 RepID=UPI000E31B3C3|nr:hypothetical protein [Flavobacterium psychrotrophum]
MPQITKQYTLSIRPEQFLDACSASELHEVQLLLNSSRYLDKMYPPDETGYIEISADEIP